METLPSRAPCGDSSLKECVNSTLVDTPLAPPAPYSLPEVIAMAAASAALSLLTVLGNVLVMLSYKVNARLQTVNNFYLLSLALADLIIGLFSMNLYTGYILMGRWALGSTACDLWLALDYVASNASVMNLLVISFDRYFSISRPLTYRAKRTPRRAGVMIGSAWLVSLMLWAPPILCWQYVVGERTVPPGQCQIQFLSEPVITFGTAIAAFYVPVSIMTVLYCKIYRETQRRTKNLQELQGRPARDGLQEVGARTRCFGFRAKRDGAQASWSSSNQSYATRSDRVVTLNSFTSSEDEEATQSFKNQETRSSNREDPADQSNDKRGVSYKFKPTLGPASTADTSSSLSVARTSSSSSSSKPDEPNSKLQKRKRMVLVKERKAAQTLSAILLAFLLTWTPYNIMVLVSTFCSDCIPVSLWHLGYWLCYVNSTVNPMCYALCNKTFQKTFCMLIFCKWRRNREEKLYWGGATNH